MTRSSHLSCMRLAAIVAGVLGLAAVVIAQPQARPSLSLGVRVEAVVAERLPAPRAQTDARPPIVWIRALWQEVEREPGSYDWSALEPAVSALAASRYRIALCLSGTNPLYIADGGPPSSANLRGLEAWLAFLREAVRRFGDRVATFQIWEVTPADGGETDLDAAGRAFVLKQSALAIRAQARELALAVQVAQAAVPLGSLDHQRKLWSQDIAPYIDVLPILVDRDEQPEALESKLEPFLSEILLHPPAPAVWAFVQGPARGPDWPAEALAASALGAGASAALLSYLDAEADPDEQRLRWPLALHDWLGDGLFAPAPIGRARIESPMGSHRPGDRILGRFFSDRDFTGAVIYQAPPLEAPAEPSVETLLVVDAPSVTEPRLLDPTSGELLTLPPAVKSSEAGLRRISVARARAPLAALFKTPGASPGLGLQPEELEVATRRGLTAEEIIARHQEVQRLQDDRLERWMARGRIDLHYKLAQGGSSIDLTIESNYFWERGGKVEWEQTDYFVNGNRINWKTIPELPLIQPEKVVTLPLDLTLDKTYSYRLIGEDRVDGREAYELEFQPADPQSPLSLYRGRVWIDRQTFVRLKASVIQTGLDPPILSNEELDRYGPQIGPDANAYWMLSRIDGQQVWNAFGRTFVVRRELSFLGFEINPPREMLEARRQAAYASGNQVLRDTDRGFRYLERQADGSRVVKEGVDTTQFFAGGGAIKDSSTSGVRPLAGVNYVNFGFGERNIQMNALFAGVFGLFTASKPDLFGGKLDASADASVLAIKLEDKFFKQDEEVLEERIETRPQHAALRLGFPLGEFFKLNLVGGMNFRQYFENDDAQAALRAFNDGPDAANLVFLLPEDHLQLTGTLEAEFNRRGYSLRAAYSRARRSKWEAWGLFDTSAGTFGSFDPELGVFVPGQPEPLQQSFGRWNLSAFKEWYLPRFQKLRAEASYLDGSDLDRFSRYSFSMFGEERLDGFSGSGVRFDDALIARAGYSFNLFEVIRLDTTLSNARVSSQIAGAARQSFTGAGLSGNVVAPWKTVISMSYGRALASDIPGLEGEQEFLLLVLKLF